MDDLELAQQMYQEAMDATREQRTQIEDDLRFSDPSDPQQWDDTVKRDRETDPGGARPCLVMDHTGQYVANVAGQVTKNPPAIHTVPVGGGADVKVSEQIDGMLRHIEYASRAQTHYGIALTSAARTGVGYLIVRPEYTDRALGYQEPRISSEADPLRVVRDPWDVTLDGSNGDFGYLLTSLSVREFERRFGKKADKVSFGSSELERRNRRDEPKSIIIAEQWLKVEELRNVVVYVDANGEKTSGTEDEYHAACQAAGMTLQYITNETEKERCVKWRILSGAEVLETAKNEDGSEAYYPADAIGIVPVYGYWGIKDGRISYCGIPRRARNPQRAYNYHMSEQLAYMGTAPKAPWVAAARAIAGQGIQQMWERSAVDQRAVLVYNDVDAEGKPIPAPVRPSISVNLTNHIQGAQQALSDIEAAIGMYRANLGAPSNETSGVAIDARKEQGEAATAHFPQNLAASLGQVGRICLQMAPKLIDTKRQQRILGIDMKPGVVTIDPKAAQAMSRAPDGVITINPNVGEYDVRVVVGTSYSTQRSQAQAALSEVMTRNPALTPAIAPLWAQNLDFPHADKLAQVLIAMAPEPVQAILNPDQAGKPTLEQVMQKNQELEQTMQMMQQAGATLQRENMELKASKETEEGELLIKGYAAVTDRMQALAPAIPPDAVQGIVMQTLQALAQQPVPLPPEGMEPQGLPMEQMEQPPPMPPDMGQMQQPMNPPSAGFSLPEQPQLAG